MFFEQSRLATYHSLVPMALIQYLQGDLTQVKHAWTKAAQDDKEPARGVFAYQDVFSQNIREESTTKSHWQPLPSHTSRILHF